MDRLRYLLVCVALLAPLTATAQSGAYADEDRDWGVAPSAQLRRPPYSAPTPREIPGGRVATTLELKAMLDGAGPPLVIDVISGEGHISIAGALWLPGAGHGTHFVDPLQALFAERLGRLTGGDKSRPLAFFCVNAQCWLSYNAALRALALGYGRVYWYRGGIESWRAAGLPLARVQQPAAE